MQRANAKLEPERIAAIRSALETSFGLALDGLSPNQVESAIEVAAGRFGASPEAAKDDALLALVLDALPIDESWLFRDVELWRFLRDRIAPALLEAVFARGRAIRVLSLGCSLGQEAFSLAMLLQEFLEAAGIPASQTSAYVQVVGIDCSAARVALASGGLLNSWSVERCPDPSWLRGRVELLDGPARRYRVAPSIQAMCRFEVGNLLEIAERGEGALAGFDLVLCRHVFIYFRQAMGERLVRHLAAGLDPGAVLVLAAPEAHLLSGAAGLEPLSLVGAARARPASPALPMGVSRPKPRHRAARRATVPPAPRATELSGCPAARPAEREPPADPVHSLVERMLLGSRLLAGEDRRQGLQVLREVLACAARLPADASLPTAPDLSVGQLAQAVKLLLGKMETS